MRNISLKTTVKAATIGAAIGCTLIFAAIVGAYSVFDRAQARVTFADTLSVDVSKLNLLTMELFVHHSPRVRDQWNRQYALLVDRLALAPPFVGEGDLLSKEIGQRLQSIKQLVDRAEGPLASEQSGEARYILLSAVIGQSSAMVSRATELHAAMFASAAQARRFVLLSLGAAFLAVMIGGGFFLLSLSKGMLSQILRLQATIGRISHGDLEAEIPEHASNEMGEVFRELDLMRRNLLESMSELGRANLELVSIKAKLEDRTIGLEAANRELDAFTSAVSHDLRTPLRTISGFSQAVMEDYCDKLDEEGKEMLGRIHRATRQMHQLIEDLLKLSKLGQRSLELTEVNLSRLASEVGDAVREQEPGRKVRLTIEPEVTATCDERMLRIVLTNLIGNAWKFTARTENAEIVFGEAPGKGRPTFFVRDNGAGFDMAFSTNLFKPFKRLHSMSDFPGTGIGLATVQRIISLHGGKIWARSSPGEGATFYFCFGHADAKPADEAGNAALPQPDATDNDARSGDSVRLVAGQRR